MKRPKVLVAKVGLDGHDVGAKVVARGLADAGMEVIYTGLRQSPEQVVAAALQEDVDVVGVSSLSGSHMYFLPRLARMLQEAGAGDILLVVGGVIPQRDIPALLAAGVSQVFHSGTRVPEMVADIEKQLKAREATGGGNR